MVRELQVMQTTRPTETRAALYRGGLVEIGARATVPAPSRAHIALAFAAIYLIWGSTYLRIRYAVETIPPLLMMGTRHLTAGLFTYAFVRRRGGPAPQPAQWMYAAVLGARSVPGWPWHSRLGRAENSFGISSAVVCHSATVDRFTGLDSAQRAHSRRQNMGRNPLGICWCGAADRARRLCATQISEPARRCRRRFQRFSLGCRYAVQ